MKSIIIYRDGQEYGPYTAEMVKEYLASGNLSADDYAREETSTQWTTVRSLLEVPKSLPQLIQPVEAVAEQVPHFAVPEGDSNPNAPSPTSEITQSAKLAPPGVRAGSTSNTSCLTGCLKQGCATICFAGIVVVACQFLPASCTSETRDPDSLRDTNPSVVTWPSDASHGDLYHDCVPEAGNNVTLKESDSIARDIYFAARHHPKIKALTVNVRLDTDQLKSSSDLRYTYMGTIEIDNLDAVRQYSNSTAYSQNIENDLNTKIEAMPGSGALEGYTWMFKGYSNN
jgi:hypothetical protein